MYICRFVSMIDHYCYDHDDFYNNMLLTTTSKLRREVYQGLLDVLHVGEYNAANVGQQTILSSSFIGIRRDLTQRYEDGMEIVLNDDKLNIFLTMTCNPYWSEIISELQQLRVDVIDKGALGNVKSYMYRILPHVHMLLNLENNDKSCSTEEYDAIVRAQIPNYEEEPQLHHAVLKHMIHGPYDIVNLNGPCMKDRCCKKNS
ncbi:hypothetical protein Lal_00019372 [Lupinus albus]|nr:hypothetical protein Lal_00019372 [Lupinus albus]